VFDPRNGEVVSALFSGTFVHTVGWGALDIPVEVKAELSTVGAGGLRGPDWMWGLELHAWCGDPDQAGCRRVPSVRYDERGYVNAPGFLLVDSPVADFVTYSALGEARFSEVPSNVPITPPVALAPPEFEAASALSRVSRARGPEVVPLAGPGR
jgi:hypothetical protein